MTDMTILNSAILRARYASQTPRVIPERPKAPSKAPSVDLKALRQEAEHKTRLDAAIAKAIAMFPLPTKPEVPEISTIRKIVAAHYGLMINEIISPRRQQNLVHARHVAFYLCKTLTDKSFPCIGRFFGDRDHSTVIHGIQHIKDRLNAGDEELKATIEYLAAKIKG